MIGAINNLEIGLTVRNKLNQVIDFVDNYNANPPLLADILGNSNKTGGHDIISDDSNSFASIVNGQVLLFSGTTDAGRVYLSDGEANLYNNNGGFYVSEGTITVPNYIQLKSNEAIIRHVDKLTISTPLTTVNSDTTVNGFFNAISNDGNSSIVAEDGDTYSQWSNGIISSYQSNDANESSLNFYNGSFGFTAFIKAKEFSNDIFHSVKNVFNSPINEFTNGGAYFFSGIGIDTTATAGTDVLNIGATNANVINYGNASTIHNFLGTAIYELQANSYVEDKLITLNHGGSVASGIGVGFEIEEAGGITGFLKTNATRDGFSFQAPSIVHTAHFLFSSFTADRTFDLPDSSGTLSLQSYVDAKVTDTIVNGVTTVAPSQNAVFDALITKADKQNGLVNGGTITVGTYGGTGTNNDIRVAAATWFISPSNYSTAGNTDFLDITLAATGLQRYVGFYGDNTNTITMVNGAESEYAVYPSTPVGKALIGYVLVTDSAASSTPDLSGYMLISNKATVGDALLAVNNSKYVTPLALSNFSRRLGYKFSTTLVPNTTNIEILHSYLVNGIANVAGRTLDLFISTRQTSDANTKTWRVYFNTTNDLTGAVLVAKLVVTTNGAYFPFQRFFHLVNNTTIFPDSTSSASHPTAYSSNTSASPANITVPNMNNNFYILITCQKQLNTNTVAMDRTTLDLK